MALLGDPPVTIAFSMIGVLGDYFLKLASTRGQPLRTEWFYLGFALYAPTAFGPPSACSTRFPWCCF